VALTALALANAPASPPSGTVVRDNIRAISQDPQGVLTDNVPTALKILAANQKVNYDGPSGPLNFAENGDVKGVFFRYEQIRQGKLVLVKVA
jgi:branched-chain amino acid transport system substrate-binding protein